MNINASMAAMDHDVHSNVHAKMVRNVTTSPDNVNVPQVGQALNAMSRVLKGKFN